jgi:integral membrane protein (TIGR01906 family)
MKTKLLTVTVITVVALLIITASIALPILIRPFYYAHVDALGLDKLELKYFKDISPLSKQEIKQAYNEMMDYCLGFRSDFSAGVLPFSEEGASHFHDVKKLFILDLSVLAISAVALVALVIVIKKRSIRLHRFLGRSAPFWSVISIASVASVIGIACAVNFKKTFEIFHKIFFPGKTNWKFKPAKDPIIELLPNQFFANCALLIFGAILAFCIGIMIYEFIPKKVDSTKSASTESASTESVSTDGQPRA